MRDVNASETPLCIATRVGQLVNPDATPPVNSGKSEGDARGITAY